jgi:glycosyltransferase involved in cell wall biosynthesis
VTAQPPVTAVIPTHRRPEMMRRAVSSVLDQTYAGEVEVLVVFDACEPVLPDVEVPAGRTLRALVNDRRRGLAGGRNTGILAAQSDLVAFLDDDDRWMPEKLDRQVAALDGRPDAVLVATAMEVDAGDRTHERRVGTSALSHRDLLHDRIASVHSSSFLVRRDALLGPLGLVDEEIPQSYGEDYDLLLRASALAPVAIVDEPLVEVTWQGGSLFVGRWGTYAEAWQYLLAKHAGFGEHRRARAQMEAKIGLALAAHGERGQGARWAARALRHDPRHLKSLVALAVAARLTSAERVVRTARRFGRGV